jgi:hypothetical protein
VLATYPTLSKELHFAQPPPDRSMRYSKVHQSRRSPLVACSFWRVCLDEAQMIEGSVTSAATVACLIPRIVLTRFYKSVNICFRMRGVFLGRHVNEMLPIYTGYSFSSSISRSRIISPCGIEFATIGRPLNGFFSRLFAVIQNITSKTRWPCRLRPRHCWQLTLRP